jgi:23S rRNA pseudouridine1911/1915/1917 synthase
MVNKYALYPQAHEIGERLDKFIARYLTDLTRSFIQKAITSGNVITENIAISNCSHKVLNQKYYITLPEPEDTTLQATNIPLNIIFEDDDILVINKQHGLTTHPGAGNNDNTLVNALIYHFGNNLSSEGGADRPGIVHRLDKDTSGLIIVAKNNFAHSRLSAQLQDRSLSRIYHALCWKEPLPHFGTIQTNIRRCRKNRLKMEVCDTDGKFAHTDYLVLKTYYDKLSLIECKLHTGRTHQIRVHMSHLGYPIIGDSLYGSSRKSCIFSMPEEFQNIFAGFNRQALIAKKISFIHPRSEEIMHFEINYDQDLTKIIQNIF